MLGRLTVMAARNWKDPREVGVLLSSFLMLVEYGSRRCWLGKMPFLIVRAHLQRVEAAAQRPLVDLPV